MLQVLVKNKEVFSEKLGLCTSYVHKFTVTDQSPYSHKARPIPAMLVPKVNQLINQMLADKVIRVSNSCYINPLCIVLKADNSVRLTLDARRLNERTVSDTFNNRNIDQLLHNIAGSRFYSRLDLTNSYWQLKLDPLCQPYTAFLHNGVQYCFCRAPFGHSTSNSGLLRALHQVFKEELESFVVCFTDDLLIMDNSYEEHMKHLDIVLHKLKTNGFTIKPTKTHLVQREVNFLGFIVSEVGLRPDPLKIDSILEIPRPRNVRQLRQFLGVCQYQARFLLGYASEAQPLRALLHKGRKWSWTSVEQEAFEKIKRLFAESVLLKRPNYDYPYVIYTDASLRGISGVLTQEYDNEIHVISTSSRGLSSQETRLFPTELEVCAVYFALVKFRDYVFNHNVTVRSDAISLSFMNRCKLTNSRISRFIHEILSYKVQVEYVPGKKNLFADLLSRLPRNQELRNLLETRESKEYVIMRIANCDDVNLTVKFRDIRQLQDQDPILSKIKSKAPQIEEEHTSKYAIKDNVLYKLCGREHIAWKTCIPSSMETDLIQSFHTGLAHSGVERTVLTMSEHLYVKQLGRKARKLIAKCELCQKAKELNIRYDVDFHSVLREKALELVCIDGHGPLLPGKYAFKYLLVMFDVFSKFVKIYPVRALTTANCLKKVRDDFIPKYGKMKALLSDNGSMFASPKWRNYFDNEGIKVLHSSAYHPQSNVLERQNRTISTYLRIFCHQNHRGWVDYIPIVENIMNNTPNPSTKISPALLFTGKEPRPVLEGIPPSMTTQSQSLMEKCKVAFQRQKKRAEKRKAQARRSKHKWNPQLGDLVLVKDKTISSKLRNQHSKMNLVYRGPLKVSRIFGNHTYELSHVKTNQRVGVFHKQIMRKMNV